MERVIKDFKMRGDSMANIDFSDPKNQIVMYDYKGNRIYDLDSSTLIVVSSRQAAEYVAKHSMHECKKVKKPGFYVIESYDIEPTDYEWVDLLGKMKEYADIMRSCGLNVEIKYGQCNWSASL